MKEKVNDTIKHKWKIRLYDIGDGHYSHAKVNTWSIPKTLNKNDYVMQIPFDFQMKTTNENKSTLHNQTQEK
jgi:hypothetical protein